jgi:type IV pilus assembly protein PilV
MKSINLKKNFKKISQQKGAVMLEALIAVLIFSFGILAISGLQAAMIKNTANSKYRSDASFIAQQTLGKMWANPANLSTFVVANENISSLLPGGTRTIALPAGTVDQVQITIGWQAPGDPDAHNHVVNARIVQGGGA